MARRRQTARRLRRNAESSSQSTPEMVFGSNLPETARAISVVTETVGGRDPGQMLRLTSLALRDYVTVVAHDTTTLAEVSACHACRNRR